MRTEQTNYMQKAERMAYMMDLEEQAARAAKSVWQTEVSETRLANLRKEAETMLKEWQASLKIIDNEVFKASKQRENICYVDKVFFLFAWGDKRITEEEYIFRKGQQEKVEKILAGLQKTQDALLEAMIYLEEYLHPSQEGNASQSPADLPFASNFGVIAQSPAGTLQTPKQIAIDYVREILRQEGDTMYNEFKRGVKGDVQGAIKEMSADTCWDLIDDALYRLENMTDIQGHLNMAAAEELEKEWREYPQVSRDFQYVVEMVKEWFLYW